MIYVPIKRQKNCADSESSHSFHRIRPSYNFHCSSTVAMLIRLAGSGGGMGVAMTPWRDGDDFKYHRVDARHGVVVVVECFVFYVNCRCVRVGLCHEVHTGIGISGLRDGQVEVGSLKE